MVTPTDEHLFERLDEKINFNKIHSERDLRRELLSLPPDWRRRNLIHSSEDIFDKGITLGKFKEEVKEEIRPRKVERVKVIKKIKRWDYKEQNKLLKLLVKGYPPSYIAKQLKRTKGSVYSKIRRI
jgi:hypothetical protein